MNGMVVDLTDDGPVDLSSHGVRDNSIPLDLHVNGSTGAAGKENDDFNQLDVESREAALRSLEEELRNEETRLLLLKKLRLSQVSKSKTATVQPMMRTNGHSTPPHRQQVMSGMSQAMTQQLPMASKSLIRSPPYTVSQQRQASSTNQSIAGQIQREIDMIQQQQQQQLSVQQRQAAAKQALRKQLEQTLLQIPPPKPPPPSITLLPNGNSAEFLALVGLEECVALTEREKSTENKATGCIDGSATSTTEKQIKSPYVCSECVTDFTPLWIEVSGTNRVVCEICDSNNRKQALKAEHTNRLKNAFLKALQQEQAIDQQVAGLETNSIGSRVQSSGGTGPRTQNMGGTTSRVQQADRRSSQAHSSYGSSAARPQGSAVPHQYVTTARAAALTAEELARRMIAQRGSTIGAQQYRVSPNQTVRSSNGIYDRSVSSANQLHRAVSQSTNRSAQYNRIGGRAANQLASAAAAAAVHIDLTDETAAGASRYKMMTSDDGRYRPSPYSRT